MKKLTIGMMGVLVGVVFALGITGCPVPGSDSTKSSLKDNAGKVEAILAQLDKQET